MSRDPRHRPTIHGGSTRRAYRDYMRYRMYSYGVGMLLVAIWYIFGLEIAIILAIGTTIAYLILRMLSVRSQRQSKRYFERQAQQSSEPATMPISASAYFADNPDAQSNTSTGKTVGFFYCHACGSAVDDDSAFCVSCGVAVRKQE